MPLSVSSLTALSLLDRRSSPMPRSTFGAERALEIQEELRQRLRDAGRSPVELEYIDRLLRRF